MEINIPQTSNPAFRRPDSDVLRRFSDFLGLHAKLAAKHVPLGVILPPAPEKSVVGQELCSLHNSFFFHVLDTWQ